MDASGAMVAMANVVSDLLAPTVWHIGLFMVATARHGDGSSQRIYRGLEAWAGANGASWLRLGVVQGNVKAERFWERLGFAQVRTRSGVKMGRLTNTIRVMIKLLRGGTLEQYLALVERDGPEAASDILASLQKRAVVPNPSRIWSANGVQLRPTLDSCISDLYIYRRCDPNRN